MHIIAKFRDIFLSVIFTFTFYICCDQKVLRNQNSHRREILCMHPVCFDILPSLYPAEENQVTSLWRKAYYLIYLWQEDLLAWYLEDLHMDSHWSWWLAYVWVFLGSLHNLCQFICLIHYLLFPYDYIFCKWLGFYSLISQVNLFIFPGRFCLVHLKEKSKLSPTHSMHCTALHWSSTQYISL